MPRNDAVPTSGKIIVASLAEAAAFDMTKKTVAAVAANSKWNRATNRPTFAKTVGIIDSTIGYVNP